MGLYRNEICLCPRRHYPLEFFWKGNSWLATRGTKPVENILRMGWKRGEPSPLVKRVLREGYDQSHRFDWFHTPPYLDDQETHLRMKKETRR